MKKLLIIALSLSCLALPVFASGSKEEATPVVEEKVMTHDELVAAAKEEGKVVVYATTSRIAKAAEAFSEKYGIETETSNLKESDAAR